MTPKITQVRAVSAVENGKVGARGGSLAVDGLSNTYWSAPTRTGYEPALTVTFASKIDLKKLIVTSGTGTDKTHPFEDYARPAHLHLLFDTGKVTDIDLTDSAAAQTHDVANGSGITKVTIYVSQTNKALRNKREPMALAEIEFYQQK